MKKNYANVMHHFLKLVILTGFVILMASLIYSGEILLYVAPHLVKYVELATAGLVIFAGFQLYTFIRSFKTPVAEANCEQCHDHSHSSHSHDHNHDHSHDHGASKSPWKKAVMYGLFLLPLLLGAFLPSEAFAGALATNKGMNLGGSAAAGINGIPADLAQLQGSDDAALKDIFQTDNYNRDYAKLGMLLYKQDQIEMSDQWFIEKLQALNTFAGNFEGKQIKVRGFIYREDGLQGNQFIIGRMAMTHCIADISPYGIIVESPEAANYANDSWVTITGTLSTTIYHEQTVIKMLVQSVEPAEAPTIPYIYPDWDFAKKLKS